MFKTIMWAADRSPATERVLPVAKELAADNGAKLILTHVEPVMTVAGKPVFADSHELLDADLRHIVDDLTGAGIDAELLVAEAHTGHTAEKFADLTREAGADLIILGGHGKGAVAGLFVGSFLVDLLKITPCAVLVIPPPPQHA